MKALRKLAPGPGNVEIVDVQEPKPGPGEVLVEVALAGVCGTDVHIFHDVFPKVRPPVTLGHEFCGVVVEVGPGVIGWEKGDRVTVESAAGFCTECVYCKEGKTQLCEHRVAFGYGRDGGFAPFVVARAEALHRLPENISLEEGALCEPLACATHAVLERSSLTPGKLVIVVGPGPIGLLVAQVSKSQGARVMVVGLASDQERLELAKRLGAERCLVAEHQEAAQEVKDWTQGQGAHIAFECSGAKTSFSACIEWVRKGGEIIQVGLLGKPSQVDLDGITFKELEVKGSFAHNRGSWEKAIDLLKRRWVETLPLVSGIFPLERWSEAFERFERREGLKYLLSPR